MVAALMEDTPLGQTVLIRKEDDKERLRHFGKYENHIRNNWRNFRASQKLAPSASEEGSSAFFENIFVEGNVV